MTGTVNWGKYKGMAWTEVPEDYLRWLIGQKQQEVRDFEAELRRRETPANPGSLLDIINAGYRKLAVEYHPDHNGDKDLMQKLNDAVEQLRTFAKGRAKR